jgi:hypothetical protein
MITLSVALCPLVGTEAWGNARGEDCKSQIDIQTGGLSKLISPLKKLIRPYTRVEPFYRVHQSCLEDWGQDLQKTLVLAQKQGMSCLENLAKDSPLSSGVNQNLIKLKRFFDGARMPTRPISIVCDQEDFKWGIPELNFKGLMHPSTEPLQSLTPFGPIHPFISIRPKALGGIDHLNVKDIGKSIFHDHFHHIGHVHGEDFEYAESCADCCFDSNPALHPEVKKVSCRLCRGEYTSLTDEQHIFDYEYYAHQKKLSPAYTLPLFTTIVKKDNKLLHFFFLSAHLNKQSQDPIGHAMAKELAPFITQQNPQEKKDLELLYSGLKNPKPQLAAFERRAQLSAQIYIALFRDKNRIKAFTLLEQNIEELSGQKFNRNPSLKAQSSLDKTHQYLIWFARYLAEQIRAQGTTRNDSINQKISTIKWP